MMKIIFSLAVLLFAPRLVWAAPASSALVEAHMRCQEHKVAGPPPAWDMGFSECDQIMTLWATTDDALGLEQRKKDADSAAQARIHAIVSGEVKGTK